ncbi:hypothetical protein OROMI_016836 [Orobanche minor]
MSSGVKGAAARGRVSIPSSIKKTIENIKEITGPNHSEDEIYALLKECSMDPNETAQKLLLLDTFHEVKKKRDRKKENLNKDPAESTWNEGSQARVRRPGLGNYSPRHVSPDAAGGRHLLPVKQSSISQIPRKLVTEARLATAQEPKNNEASSNERCYSPFGATSQVTNSIHQNHVSACGVFNQHIDTTGNTTKSMSERSLLFSSSLHSSKDPDTLGTRDITQNELLDSSNTAISVLSVPAPGSHLSSSDPILLPLQDFSLASAVVTSGREMGSKHAPIEPSADISTERTSASAMQQMPIDFQEVGKTQYVEFLPFPSSTMDISSASRLSSNYNNRSEVVGPQKEVSTVSGGSRPESQQTPEKSALELPKKFERLDVYDSQNVIIPNHLQVPDAGKLGFCFGSFDASFRLDMNQKGGLCSEKSPLLSESYCFGSFDASFALDMNQKGGLGSERSPLLSESYEANEEPEKELQLSNQTVLAASENTETKYHDHTQSHAQGPGDFPSGVVEVSSSTTSGYGESKLEVTPGSYQHPVVNYAFMRPILSSQLTPFESLESQARDVRQLPGFVVQQHFDPESYYKQSYRSGIDNEGGISHVHSAVASNEEDENAALLSTQTSQSSQESSIASIQHPFPIFPHPAGVHLPHYPPFIPYGPYFTPYYVPSPAIHQFLSNGVFPIQPHSGSFCPTPSGTTTKYSVSQCKQGSNTGSSSHIGSYGQYGLSMMPSYTSSSVTAVTSSSNENLAAPQRKENNISLSGEQNENSGVDQPGQLAAGLPLTTGIFHPAAASLHPLLQQSQSITMVGPTDGVYYRPPLPPPPAQQRAHDLTGPSNL